MKKVDITNRRFGRLVAIEFHSEYRYPNGERGEKWICKCDCGNETIVARKNLLNGNTQSCGCISKESNKKRLRTHGGKGTRLYDVWCSIKYRCYNPNCSCYNHYGGRGIKMCDLWEHDFAAFREWSVNNGYSEHAACGACTIDRIDANGDYEPQNCRWVDMTAQANNRTNSIIINYMEESHTCSEWARILGIPYDRLHNRYTSGLPIEQVFSKDCLKPGPK